MDAIEKESRLLYDICCSIGFSNRQLKRNIQFIDCATTMINMSFIDNFSDKTIICGSRSEGMSPFAFPLNQNTDLDSVSMVRGINVQEHIDTTNTNQTEVLQLLHTKSPEHVLLEVKCSKSAYKTFTTLWWMPKVIVGNLVSSSRFKDAIKRDCLDEASSCPSFPISNVNDMRNNVFQCIRNLNKATIHGPAVMTENIPLSGFGDTDNVYCLRCYEWPSAAHEWIDRARPHNWPSQDQIDQIMNDGCELVPVGRKDHRDVDVEWKLSFSRAETRLIRNFNIYQVQCYQLLKIIQKHCVSSVVAESLSSYHIKTVMLHTVEQTDPKVWRKDNLAQCFMMCLSNLKRYLTDKFLPQYFIVRQNLLEPKLTGDVHQKVLKIVTDLDRIGWKCILQCPLFPDLYQSIRETVDSFPFYTLCTNVMELEGNRNIVVSFCRGVVVDILSQVKSVSYHFYVIKSVYFCEKTILKPTAIHPSVETARMLQLLRKATLGFLLTVIQAMAHPDLRPGIEPLMDFAQQCLEESCHADVSCCRLKFATFFFYRREYHRCIATVQDVLTRFKDVSFFVGGLETNCDNIMEALENMETSTLQFKLHRVLPLFDNGFPFISNHMSLPAFFTHWEVAVAPKGVHYVHKKMHCHNVLTKEVCFIDSIVYAHYLLVESYLRIDEHEHAERALINMNTSIRNGKDNIFDRNCLCFCIEDILLLHYSKHLVQVTKNLKDKLKSEHEDV